MPKSDVALLKDMLDMAVETRTLTRGRGRKDPDANRLLSLSLVRLLEIVGEAAANVSPDFRSKHPEVPWGAIVGTRNRLVHAYSDVNLDVVRSTIEERHPAPH
jgi:uncharacterized protein with HEPN domain